MQENKTVVANIIYASGEDLYITPIAYCEDGRNNIIFYIKSEFEPYSNDFSPNDGLYWQKLNPTVYYSGPLWFRTKGCLTNLFNKTKYKLNYLSSKIISCSESSGRLFDRFFLSDFIFNWNNCYPHAGIDFGPRFNIKGGQLQIIDNNGHIDQCYAIPSQKYLKERFDNYITFIDSLPVADDNDDEIYIDNKKVKAYSFEKSDVKEYKNWKQNMEKLGYSIGFVAELET